MKQELISLFSMIADLVAIAFGEVKGKVMIAGFLHLDLLKMNEITSIKKKKMP
jgi:hypothetical protein